MVAGIEAQAKGQIAVEIAKYFTIVFATDIIQSPLNGSEKQKNIVYKKRGEQTGFKNDEFDFIAVAQAIQWFDLEEFYPEVLGVAKNGDLIGTFKM